MRETHIKSLRLELKSLRATSNAEMIRVRGKSVNTLVTVWKLGNKLAALWETNEQRPRAIRIFDCGLRPYRHPLTRISLKGQIAMRNRIPGAFAKTDS
jgi:hypothetical protein